MRPLYRSTIYVKGTACRTALLQHKIFNPDIDDHLVIDEGIALIEHSRKRSNFEGLDWGLLPPIGFRSGDGIIAHDR